MPPGLIGAVDPTSERVRALRSHPACLSASGSGTADAFWEHKYRFLALRSTILLHSPWAGTPLAAMRVADLAKATGLSARSTNAVIDCAARTGDLVKRSDADDARLRILEPTERLTAGVDTCMAQWLDAMSRFTRQPNPLASPHPSVMARARRVFLELTLWVGDPRLARRSVRFPRVRFYVLWDLLLHAPRAMHPFAAEEAAKLGMTAAAVQKEIARARQDGWLEPEPHAVPTAMAEQRFRNLFTVLERRWTLALELIAGSEELGALSAPACGGADARPVAARPAQAIVVMAAADAPGSRCRPAGDHGLEQVVGPAIRPSDAVPRWVGG